MFGRARALLPLLILALLLPSGAAMAQTFGRVVIVAMDTEGNKIADVNIVVTCETLTNFRQEKSTNKKGKATFSFIDATHTYQFKMSFEGFPPIDVPIKPNLRSTITREITVGGADPDAPVNQEEVVYTLSERIFNEGVVLLRKGNVADAKAKFLDALDNNPSLFAARSALAGVYLEEGDHENAITSAKVIIDVEPDKPRGYYILYDAYRAQGNQAAADEALETLKGLETGGDAAAMIFNDGVAAYKLGDYKRARVRFEEALQMQPEMNQAEAALARIYLLQESYAEAAASSEKLLARDPSDKAALQIRYDAYSRLGDETKAAEAFDALAKVDPAVLAGTMFEEGHNLFQAGDVDGALSKLSKVLQLQPEHGKAHYLVGLCYVNKDDKPKAKEHLQKFVDLSPSDPDVAAAKSMLDYL